LFPALEINIPLALTIKSFACIYYIACVLVDTLGSI